MEKKHLYGPHGIEHRYIPRYDGYSDEVLWKPKKNKYVYNDYEARKYNIVMETNIEKLREKYGISTPSPTEVNKQKILKK